MNYNELSGGPLYKAVRQWLDNNPGKDLGDFAKETGYKGKPLKIKDPKTGRVGLKTTTTDATRKTRLVSQDTEYIQTLQEMGYSESEAKERLKQSKLKVAKIRSQVTELNKEFGKGSFTVGHLTAVAEGGGDFGRNVRLEIGKTREGMRGNFSRSNVDELPRDIKAALGIPSSGREAAIMDESGLFDLPLTPKDRQEIFRNPDQANDIIQARVSQVETAQPKQRQQPTTPIDAPETGPNALRVARNLAPAALSIPAGLAVSAQSAAAAVKQPTEENIVNAGFDIGNTAADLVGLIPTPMTIAGSEAAQRALMMGQMTYNAQRQMQKQEQEGGKETMAGFDILNELEYIGNQLRNFKMPYRRFGGSYTPMKDR